MVVGLDNPILTDDGVDIYIVREAAKRCGWDDVAFAEASVGGLGILDTISGYECVVLVDAIQTGTGKPGDIHHLNPNDLRASRHSGAPHDFSLPGALALGRGMGMTLPRDEALSIVAVEVEDVLTFGEECTGAVDAVLAELEAGG